MQRRRALLVATLASVALVAVGSPAFASAHRTAKGAVRLQAAIWQKSFTVGRLGYHEQLTTAKTTVPAGDAITSWTVRFGDKSAPIGGHGTPPKLLLHTYAKPGRWFAVLKIRDSRGATSSSTCDVDYAGKWTAPTLTLTSTIAGSASLPSYEGVPVEVGQPLVLKADMTEWYGVKSKVSVDWGDGTKGVVAHPASVAVLSHRYTAPGNHGVKVTLTDGGGASITRSREVAVSALSKVFMIKSAFPTPEAGGSSVLVTAFAALPTVDVPFSNAPVVVDNAYARTLTGDAGTTITPAASAGEWNVSWSTGGSHTLTATALDQYGQTHVGTLTVTVLPAPSVTLSASCSPDSDPSAGDDCSFVATPSLNSHYVTAWALSINGSELDGGQSWNVPTATDPDVFSGFDPGATLTATISLTLNSGAVITGQVTFTG